MFPTGPLRESRDSGKISWLNDALDSFHSCTTRKTEEAAKRACFFGFYMMPCVEVFLENDAGGLETIAQGNSSESEMTFAFDRDGLL